MDESTSERESNEASETNTKNIESKSDDKISESREKVYENKQQMKIKTESQSHHTLPQSGTETSTTSKRLMESNEMDDSSIKRIKSEADDKKDHESLDEIKKQKDIITRKEEESHFLRLFRFVLNTIIALKNLEEATISESIMKIIQSFKDKPQTYHLIDYTKSENICAYLYRYASHGAGFARFRILNAIQNCKVVENTLKKPDLKIICLGPGPGNDAIGLCSALSELQYPKNLKVTLCDKFKEWCLCIRFAKAFIKTDNFGNVSELFEKSNVILRFIMTNLPGNFKSDREYFAALREADVIVMSKFFTSLERSGEEEIAIIKSLHEHMKEDAVILVNDELVYVEERWSGFNLLYKWGHEPKDVYISTALAKERFGSHDNISSKLPIHVFVKKKALHNRR